jgi:Glycosyl transferase family 2
LPRFSVVVPTRDRPDLLAFCLEGLAEQTFADFEVIVADNPVSTPAREVFDHWSQDGWRYLKPERALAMHDNFERACAEATGELVAVVIDKTVLHPSALELADQALGGRPDADIVTWWNDGYDPLDEEHEPGLGRFLPAANTVGVTMYDPRAELARRFENNEPRGRDPVHYVRGKIVFGAYSRRLMDRIRAQSGRLFHPLAPDYTSMVPACVLAEVAVDLGRPLLVSYNSIRSNGRRQATDARHARRFVESVDPAILDDLPIEGVYASHHNVVAYDLVSSAARCPAGSTPPLDVPNLLHRVREDLDAVQWTDRKERATQYALLEAAEREHGVGARPSLRQARFATLKRFGGSVRLLARGPATYRSPVEAARRADRHYSPAAS